MTRTVQAPTKLIRANRSAGIPSSFSLFSQSVFLFFRFCLIMGNPWRVNNRKVITQVEALILEDGCDRQTKGRQPRSPGDEVSFTQLFGTWRKLAKTVQMQLDG